MSMTRRSWQIIGWGIIALTLVDWTYALILNTYLPHQQIHYYYERENNEDSLHGPIFFFVSKFFIAAELLIEAHEKLLIVLSTIAIAGFTGTLWRATTKLQKISERQIKTQSVLERPWIFLEGIRIRRREDQGQAIIPNFFWISFTWKNYGRVPGIVEGFIIKFVDKNALPVEPDYSNPAVLRLPRTMSPDIPVTTNQVGPPSGTDVVYNVYGEITYRELGGELRHTGFIVEVSPHMAAFSSVENDAYDYYD